MGDDAKVRRAVENATENEQKNALKNLLEKHQGNITKTAEAAGLVLSHVRRLLKKYGLDVTARELRMSAQGHSRGRPWPSTVTDDPGAARTVARVRAAVEQLSQDSSTPRIKK